jgi:hypothetical protein
VGMEHRCTNFPKTWVPPQNSAPGICAPLVWSTDPMTMTGKTAVLEEKTVLIPPFASQILPGLAWERTQPCSVLSMRKYSKGRNMPCDRPTPTPNWSFNEGVHTSWAPDRPGTTFYVVMTNICGSSVRNLLFLCWLLEF